MGDGWRTQGLFAIAAACALWCAHARAATLADGVRAYEDMELDSAVDKLAEALRTSSPQEKPHIELWLGIVELERGNEATARRWLKQALRADPALAVEQELSPKIVATIEAVRAQVTRAQAQAPLSPAVVAAAVAPVVVADPAPVAAPTSPVVTTTTTTTPTAPLVAHAPLVAAPDVSFAPPAAPPAAAPAAVPAAAPVADVADTQPVVEQGPSPLFFVTAATGAVSAGALVGGAVLGTIARVGGEAAAREPIASSATERYQEASTAAIAANGLFIAGGVAAVASAVCGVLVFVDGEAQ